MDPVFVRALFMSPRGLAQFMASLLTLPPSRYASCLSNGRDHDLWK